MSQVLDDSRNRPVVFETHAEPTVRRMRSPVRLLAGGTLVLAALTGAVGLAFGGSAVWAVVGPQVPNNAPAPLWIAPPRAITPVRTDDGHTASDLDHSKPTTTTTTTGAGATHGRDDATGSSTHDLNDPDRPATVDHASTATKAAPPATHEAAPTADNEERRKGAGGSGGTGTGGTGNVSSGGGSGGGGKSGH